MSPPIRGFIESTLLDWEGRIAAVVFLPGCNFRCGYCHARHLVTPSLSHEAIPLEAVLLNLRRQHGWIDGVVISGGEPTIHADLLDLITVFRAEGVPVKLDTNGSRPDVLARLLDLGVLDYVAMDVKASLDKKYFEVTAAAVDLDAVERSIGLLISSDVPYEFRTTVCPAHLDEQDVVRIAQVIRGARLFYLQPFRPVNCLDPSFDAIRPYNPDRMQAFRAAAAKYVRRCVVRGDQAGDAIADAIGDTNRLRLP